MVDSLPLDFYPRWFDYFYLCQSLLVVPVALRSNLLINEFVPTIEAVHK